MAVQELLYLEMERELQIGVIVSQKEQLARKNAYDQLRNKYNDKHNQDLKSGIAKSDATPRYRKYNWAGLDLTEKAKEVNLEIFHQLYKELAALSHANVKSVRDAIVGSTNGQIEVDMSLNPGPVHCYKVLDVTFTCLFGILEEYMKYFEIRYFSYPDLENLWKDYKKLLDK